jgi:hypothetical protein
VAVTKCGRRSNTNAAKRARRCVAVSINGRPLRLDRVGYVDRRRGIVRMFDRDAIGNLVVDASGVRLKRVELRGRVVVRFARA